MLCSGSVSKTKSPDCAVGLVDKINDATRIKRPEKRMIHQDGNRDSDPDRSIRGKQFDPTKIEMLPTFQPAHRALKDLGSRSEPHKIMVNRIIKRRRGARRSDLKI